MYTSFEVLSSPLPHTQLTHKHTSPPRASLKQEKKLTGVWAGLRVSVGSHPRKQEINTHTRTRHPRTAAAPTPSRTALRPETKGKRRRWVCLSIPVQ